jgi:hypothetical protein
MQSSQSKHKGLPIWVYLIIGILLAIPIFFVIRHLRETAIQTAITQATDAHGDEVGAIIAEFEIAGHNLNVYKNADERAAAYTGDSLQAISQSEASANADTVWTVVTQAHVTDTRVIEYSANKIRAVACVSEDQLQLNDKGKLLKQLGTKNFMGAYVMVNENGVWKQADYLDVTDATMAQSQYKKMSAAEQTAIGSLTYLLDFRCDSQ